MAVQQLVFQPFSHTSHDSDNHSAPPLFLKSELLDSAPYPLLGIVPDRAGVCKNEISLIDVFSKAIANLLEDGKNDLAVVDVHLTTIGLYIDFLFGRIDNRPD